MFEKEAEKKWQSKDLWYKVNADESAYKTGFKDGAKEMQKENKRLKQQIEKMKRCGNCNHRLRDCQSSLLCLGNNYKDWELAE